MTTSQLDLYTSPSIQQAIKYVQALDNGQNHIEAYLISHPLAKRSTAVAHTYTYRTSGPVRDAVSIYYGAKMPTWAQSKSGRAHKLSTITDKTINDPDMIETARKSIVDIDRVLDPIETKISVDNRSVTLITSVEDRDKLTAKLKRVLDNDTDSITEVKT